MRLVAQIRMRDITEQNCVTMFWIAGNAETNWKPLHTFMVGEGESRDVARGMIDARIAAFEKEFGLTCDRKCDVIRPDA